MSYFTMICNSSVSYSIFFFCRLLSSAAERDWYLLYETLQANLVRFDWRNFGGAPTCRWAGRPGGAVTPRRGKGITSGMDWGHSSLQPGGLGPYKSIKFFQLNLSVQMAMAEVRWDESHHLSLSFMWRVTISSWHHQELHVCSQEEFKTEIICNSFCEH